MMSDSILYHVSLIDSDTAAVAIYVIVSVIIENVAVCQVANPLPPPLPRVWNNVPFISRPILRKSSKI